MYTLRSSIKKKSFCRHFWILFPLLFPPSPHYWSMCLCIEDNLIILNVLCKDIRKQHGIFFKNTDFGVRGPINHIPLLTSLWDFGQIPYLSGPPSSLFCKN